MEQRHAGQRALVEREHTPPASIRTELILDRASQFTRLAARATVRIEDEGASQPASSISTRLSWNAAPCPMSVSRPAEQKFTVPPSEIHQPFVMLTQPGFRP